MEKIKSLSWMFKNFDPNENSMLVIKNVNKKSSFISFPNLGVGFLNGRKIS